jgi:hypothetical protein
MVRHVVSLNICCTSLSVANLAHDMQLTVPRSHIQLKVTHTAQDHTYGSSRSHIRQLKITHTAAQDHTYSSRQATTYSSNQARSEHTTLSIVVRSAQHSPSLYLLGTGYSSRVARHSTTATPTAPCTSGAALHSCSPYCQGNWQAALRTHCCRLSSS